MKTLAYTTVSPSRAGFYWWLDMPKGNPQIVRIFKDAQGHWNVQYDNLQARAEDIDFFDAWGGLDYLENYKNGQWAGPIPVPAEPEWPEAKDE